MHKSRLVNTNEITPPEVYSISVTLKPRNDGYIPYSHGFKVSALFYNIISLSSASLAEELHSLDGPKPFTVSPLQGKFKHSKDGLHLTTGTTCYLRITFLNSEVFSHFLDGAMKWGSRSVEITPMSFKVEEIITMPGKESSTKIQSYQSILNSAVSERKFGLHFLTPTVFRSGGKRNVVFPEPIHVFASYLNRWQEFSTVKLDDSISSWFDRILVARYKLETQIWDFNTYQEVGFTGKCWFEIEEAVPDETAGEINALADFAFYCGTGAKTTMGMGQTMRIK
jgi:CRISPR-associated endoribonuclease Cas6